MLKEYLAKKVGMERVRSVCGFRYSITSEERVAISIIEALPDYASVVAVAKRKHLKKTRRSTIAP